MDPMMAHMMEELEIRKHNYAYLNRLAKKGETLFVGSSLMEQFPINELLMSRGISKTVYNRGIGGFTTDMMLDSMEEMVFGLEPARIFINIGTNDISQPDYSLEKLMANYRKILAQIQERLPEAEITLLAYYPVNETLRQPGEGSTSDRFNTRNNENLREANEAVKALASEMGCRFLDVNAGLTDGDGRLKAEYTREGVHMYADAYNVVLDNLLPYL